jgi:hypothetical protein
MLTEVFPQRGASHEVSTIESMRLKDLYPRLKGFRLNYVLAPNNSASTSDSVSNELDRTILKFIRSQSDLIVTTGLTARNERLNASKYAPLLVLTRSKELLEIPAVEELSQHKIYTTQKLGMIYPNTNALAIGGFQGNLAEFTKEFCKLNNFESAVLETGPSTTQEFSKAKLIAEVDLSITSTRSEQEATLAATSFISSIGVEEYDLVQLLNHEQSWFFRFAIL